MIKKLIIILAKTAGIIIISFGLIIGATKVREIIIKEKIKEVKNTLNKMSQDTIKRQEEITRKYKEKLKERQEKEKIEQEKKEQATKIKKPTIDQVKREKAQAWEECPPNEREGYNSNKIIILCKEKEKVIIPIR